MSRLAPAQLQRAVLAAAAAAAFASAPATAQLSPGPLSRAHAGLEGNLQCLRCHDTSGVVPAKCLECHTLLAARVESGLGLHARPDHRDCKRCHMEHQGRAFELIHWGHAGRERFDHALTGHALAGRHASLACDACHRERLRAAPTTLAQGGASPQRTHLGLSARCASCHADAHAGQFGARGCDACHGQEAWKPAPGFDHGRTGFPLTGRHAGVACEGCHPAADQASAAEPGAPARLYAGRNSACSSCHRDPHAGRMGAACGKCHTTEGWREIRLEGFDHDRTSYPLRGRHRALACSSCHRPGRPYRLPHGACADCHADAHLGQLARRPDGGRCESCHDVTGFLPPHFGPEEHARGAYPLEGAHLAVACDACHRRVVEPSRVAARDGAAALAPRKPVRAARLRFASTRCADCHADPHAGEVERHLRASGCEACHDVDSWRVTRFDHSRTRLALEGAHARLACASCHARVDTGTPRARPRLAGLSVTCDGCHRDPHRGQLTRAGLASPCARCHVPHDWSPALFDHARDARHALEGAHVRLACASCHRRETAPEGTTFVRYRPLSTACRDCHAAPPAGGTEGTR